MEMADLGAGLWWNVDSGLDPTEWEKQESYVDVTAARVTGKVTYDTWVESLAGVVEVSVQVEEQYARQDQFGDHVEYVRVQYPGRIVGEVTAFIDWNVDPYFSDLVELSVDKEQLVVEPLT